MLYQVSLRAFRFATESTPGRLRERKPAAWSQGHIASGLASVYCLLVVLMLPARKPADSVSSISPPRAS
jgi:hypothetical protein